MLGPSIHSKHGASRAAACADCTVLPAGYKHRGAAELLGHMQWTGPSMETCHNIIGFVLGLPASIQHGDSAAEVHAACPDRGQRG